MSKIFKLSEDELEDLIPPGGGCIATDLITVDGEPVRYMFREDPHNEMDSGWRFFSGTETDSYMEHPENFDVHDLNTLANYDRAIIPYLEMPVGTELERLEGTDTFFTVDEP